MHFHIVTNSRYKAKNDADEAVSVVSLTSSSGGYINGRKMHFHIVKMYKGKEVNKNVKNIFLSMCDVKLLLTFASLGLVLL
jgi:hypothetical protein